MKIILIFLLVPLTSASLFGKSENCDHSPPQFKSTMTEDMNFIDQVSNELKKKCAYSEDSLMTDFVNFYFIQREYDNYQKLQEYQMTQQINQSLPTYIIFHGWKAEVADNTNNWMKATGKKILEYIDANVILIDYGSVSHCNYIFLSTRWIFKLSKYIADCAIEKWNLSSNRLKIIGHSLGAHIAGLTGTHLNGMVDEIIALDPAGPMFDRQIFGIWQDTLNSSCAQFVQVIHTKPILLGTRKHLGDSDFFANILSHQQPGCAIWDISCSHTRACELYFASIFPENKFIGYASPLSWNQEKSSRFGFFNDRTKGTFYFDTTACFGYAK